MERRRWAVFIRLPRALPNLLESTPMAKVNEHYLKLKSSYLFSEIARRCGSSRRRIPTRKSSGSESATSPSRSRRPSSARCTRR